MIKQSFRPAGVVILSLTLAMMIVSAWAAPGESSSAQPSETSIAPADLQYYWTREIDLAGAERIEQAYVMDENLYLVTSDKYFRAVDAAVGNPKWSVRVGNDDSRIFPPTHISDMQLPQRMGTIDEIDAPESMADFDTFHAVLINSLSDLLVVDRKKGNVYRDIRFGNRVATDAGVSDGTLFFVGTGDKNYRAIKLLTNVQMWKENLGQNVDTPMAYYDGKLFMGTLDGLLRCADANNFGEKRWDMKYDGSIPEALHVDARGLFFACNDRRIYGLDPYTGKNLWRPVVVKGTVAGPMQLGEKTIFQQIKNDGLYAVDITNGKVRWKLPTGQCVLTIMEGVVYVLDTDKQLRLVNEITGKETAVVPFKGFDFYVPNTTAPAIYTATRSGQVFCLRPKKAGRLTAEMLTK